MPNPSKPFGLPGQFQCGNKRCENQEGLKSWEVNFAYVEQGEKRNALVKLSKCSVFPIDVFTCGDISGSTGVRMKANYKLFKLLCFLCQTARTSILMNQEFHRVLSLVLIIGTSSSS